MFLGENKMFTKHASIIISVLMTVLMACSDTNIIVPDSTQSKGIRVSGTGIVKASPDIIHASIGVQTFDEKAKTAVDINNEKINAIFSALTEKGVSKTDFETVSFNIYPQRDFRRDPPNQIVGFQVNNTISVTIRNLNHVGEILQATIQAGANNISGINFTVEDVVKVREKARVEAVKDAKQKAESMAETLGVKVGKVISLNETGGNYPPVVRREYDVTMADAEVPIQTPSELEISITVEIIFEIE
ncbi:MAG: SIMPL domain-containing protein [Candidatus Poribacteria bacterium]